MKSTKFLAMLLSLALLGSMLSGCRIQTPPSAASSAPASPESSGADTSASTQQTAINFSVFSGPTGAGAAWLMEYYNGENAPADSPFCLNTTVLTDNSEAVAALNSGAADIAAIATNVAANLYNKTDGKITMLAINTRGVLYILEKGESIQSMADLRGKTVYAVGQGANPEYILNYLLRQNGLDPASDVTIEWMTAQEVTAKMASSEEGVCMLPVPAATALLLKDEDVREALDLSAQWDKVADSPLVMGCAVVRTEFLEKNPELVDAFLDCYRDSISFMTDENNLDDAAALVEKHGITPTAAIARAAIPQCNLTFLTGQEMAQAAQEYYQVLFQADPASIGGTMPYDDFYYQP